MDMVSVSDEITDQVGTVVGSKVVLVMVLPVDLEEVLADPSVSIVTTNDGNPTIVDRTV